MQPKNILEITTVPTANKVLVTTNKNNEDLLMNKKSSVFFVMWG